MYANRMAASEGRRDVLCSLRVVGVSIQLSTKIPGKTDDGPNNWIPASYLGDMDEAHGLA